MRLTRLRLEKYGCFDCTDLAFAAEPGRINLVVAPNGAGKSLLRQAFHDLLFDIPARTPMSFRFGYPGMALHAEAVAADDVAFSFGWARQGKPPRMTNDPAHFAALRAQTTPRQLEQLFALDTVRLRAGGMDLQGGQTLSEALLSGTGELARPRRVLQEIERRRAANWGQGRSKPPLNAALSALNEARKRMRVSVERPEHRERAERELDAQREAVAQARAERQRAADTSQRLHRIELTRPALRQLAEAQAWLEAHPDAPALPASLEKDLADARATLSKAEALLRAAEDAAAAAAEALGGIARDEAATRQHDLLAGLPEQLGSADKAGADIVAVAAELSGAEASIRAELADIGTEMAVEAAAALVPTIGLRAEAREAILSHARLSTAGSLAAEQLRAAERRLAEAAAAPVQAAPAPARLAELLAEIRADRDPAHHARELARAGRQTCAQVQAALALVPGWSAGAEALRALVVPQHAVFQRLDAARTEAARALRASIGDQNDLTAKAQQQRRALAALRETPLPDEASIAAARADRDKGWRLIHQRAFSAEGPDIAAEGAFAADEPLPLAFERRLRAADGLADQRIAELARINEAARLMRDLAEMETHGAAAAAAVAATHEGLGKAEMAWAGTAALVGLSHEADMGDVTEFLARRSSAIDAMKADELARGEAAALALIHQGWAERLASLLSAQPQMSLADLLTIADASVKRAAAAQKTWLDWQAEHGAAQRDRQTEAERLMTAEREMADWQEQWESILKRLGRPPGETPAAAGAVLDRITELDKHARAAAVARGRIDGMRAILDRFAALVDGLAQVLDEPPQLDSLITARALIYRRDKAAAAESAWITAQQRVEQTARVLEEAREAHRLSERQCRAVVAAAGAVSLEEAEARIAGSREHSRYCGLRDAALETLATHGGGLAIETLQHQADGVPPETMSAARQTAQEEADSANRRVEAGASDLRALEDAFAVGETETRALEAAADYAAASAQYSRLLEEQLVLHLAHDMLHHALEAVQEDAGEDGVARLSRVFSALTGGAYQVALSEEDGATLLAIEARYPGELKKLDQLSEGTRDQLYLALRILALREHAAGAMPLPFIADDILQTFDDARAEAAMRVLMELSQDVQVIVLTHHAHLAALAAGLGDGVHVQALT